MNDFEETKNITIERLRAEKLLRYNPLNNLTPQKITRAMDSFQMGYLSEAAKIYDAIRRRDGVVLACVQKRKRATARLTWSIVAQGKDEEASSQQAEFLEDLFNNISVSSAAEGNKKGSMSLLIDNILSCLENQYAVSELIWQPRADGSLGLKCVNVPLWYFENTQGYLRFKETSFETEGVDMKKDAWLIAVNDSALMEATAVCYIIKRFALADWAIFSERFGGAIATINTPAIKGSEEFKSAMEMVSRVAQNKGIVLGQNDIFNLVQANGTGSPFQEIINEMNRMIALIWRGSDLSTLSAGNATGASLQAEENEILEDADCALVEETIAHYLILPALQWRFGKDVKVAAYLQLTRKDRKDKQSQLNLYKAMCELGCNVSKRDVFEEMNMRQPEDGEEAANISSAGFENAQQFANSKKINNTEDEIIELAKARGKDVEKFVKKLEEINELTNQDEYIDALTKLHDEANTFYNAGENEQKALQKILTKSIEE